MYLAAQALAAQAQGLGERTRASWGGEMEESRSSLNRCHYCNYFITMAIDPEQARVERFFEARPRFLPRNLSHRVTTPCTLINVQLANMGRTNRIFCHYHIFYSLSCSLSTLFLSPIFIFRQYIMMIVDRCMDRLNDVITGRNEHLRYLFVVVS